MAIARYRQQHRRSPRFNFGRWCGHEWSPWMPLTSTVAAPRAAVGVYCIRGGDGRIVYIGEGRIAARLGAHHRSAILANSPQGMVLGSAQPLTWSWVWLMQTGQTTSWRLRTTSLPPGFSQLERHRQRSSTDSANPRKVKGRKGRTDMCIQFSRPMQLCVTIRSWLMTL